MLNESWIVVSFLLLFFYSLYCKKLKNTHKHFVDDYYFVLEDYLVTNETLIWVTFIFIVIFAQSSFSVTAILFFILCFSVYLIKRKDIKRYRLSGTYSFTIKTLSNKEYDVVASYDGNDGGWDIESVSKVNQQADIWKRLQTKERMHIEYSVDEYFVDFLKKHNAY